MERIAAVFVWSTPVRRRMWRLRLVVFLVRMWRLYAPARLIEPLPRTLKRLAAPRLDFIFGMTSLPSLFSYDAGRPPQRGRFNSHGSPLCPPRARLARALLQLSAVLSASPEPAPRAFPSLAARPSSWAQAPSPSACPRGAGTARPCLPRRGPSAPAAAGARRTPCAPSRGHGSAV